MVQCQCNMRESLSKLEQISPRPKIVVTSKSPVGDISVVTLIRTDTTLDHSQKAEKVWLPVCGLASSSPAMRTQCWLCTVGDNFTIHEMWHTPHTYTCRQGQPVPTPTHTRRHSWAEALVKIARMTLTVKLDRNWSSFQLANSAPPLSVTDSAIAPSARMLECGDWS